MAAINVALLISTVAVPQLSGLLELGRLYQVILMFLSPLFVLGAEAIFKFLLKIVRQKNHFKRNVEKQRTTIALILTLLILGSFFLFQTGVIYEVSNDPVPSSYSLSYYKMQNSPWVIHESDAFSAIWLSKYGDITYIPTFADTVSYTHVLESYSSINDNMIFLLANDYKNYQNPGLTSHVSSFSNASYIYLDTFNVVNQVVQWYTRDNTTYPFSQVPILNSTNSFINRIYSNGASEIDFRSPPNP